jgi:hypothetical protein
MVPKLSRSSEEASANDVDGKFYHSQPTGGEFSNRPQRYWQYDTDEQYQQQQWRYRYDNDVTAFASPAFGSVSISCFHRGGSVHCFPSTSPSSFRGRGRSVGGCRSDLHEHQHTQHNTGCSA